MVQTPHRLARLDAGQLVRLSLGAVGRWLVAGIVTSCGLERWLVARPELLAP